MNEVLLKLYLNAAHCYVELVEVKKVLTYARKVWKFFEMYISRFVPRFCLHPWLNCHVEGVGMLGAKYQLNP